MDTPIYKRAWFWVVVGGAILLAIRRKQVELTPPPKLPGPEVAPPSGSASIDPFRTTNLSAEQERAFIAALPRAGQQYGALFAQAGREKGISPLLLAAICETETYYGEAAACKGKGPACEGTLADDFGLMQINSKAHPEFFKRSVNGTPAWKVPLENIRYGAEVWNSSLASMRGRPNSSGKVDVGARRAAQLLVKPGKYPDPRPMDIDLARWAATSGYNAGPMAAIIAVAADRSPDAVTHGSKYGKTVLDKLGRIFNKTVENLNRGAQ
jgi:hypothetical protein